MSRHRPEPSPLVWDEAGQPRSILFDDVYYSREGGLAEAGAVYLAGCGLPDAWLGRERFTVGELGFGTGLNIAALVGLWRRTRPPNGRLHIFSVEAHPLPAAEARRALGAWPEIADVATGLASRWPRRASGFHRIALDAFGVVIDIAHMDAVEALAAWDGAADAWFLDGFSPASNPGMWSDAVLAGVRRRSAPGARAATFTVAGAVRRGLAAQGFEVEKRPGFGAKRERLEARLPGAQAAPPARAPRVVIVGAGIAGAALARAFAALGVKAVVLEADAPGAGASGNAAALVMSRLDAGSGPIGALHAQALARAADLYDAVPEAGIASGALQLETGEKDAQRFDRIATSALFEPGAVERLPAAAAGERLGEPLASGALWFRDARVIEPAPLLEAWLAEAALSPARVEALSPAGDAWRLLSLGGGVIAEADIVVLANGLDAARLVPGLPLSPVRGQASVAQARAPPPLIAAGYVIPTRDGVLFGATHDRDDASDDARPADDARNRAFIASFAPRLGARLAAAPATGRASLRAATPDFLPLAGAAEARGLFVLSGLGSRGFCTAPLLAEHVAAAALGLASPLPEALAAIVHPGRFALRRRRRLGRSADVQPARSD
jgi:tRNA 5-methylaminomethyl-2-thiouridine biosynthesis bifunctional protein